MKYPRTFATPDGESHFEGQETGLTFPPLVGKERYAWVVNHLFIGVAARRMVPDVVKSARDWAADLILRESLEFSGCVAAEFLDLPHASVAAAADSALDLRSQVTMPLAQLRAQVGMPSDPEGHMAYRYLHLCFTPPRWDGAEATFPDTARFFRHTNALRPGETPPACLDELTGRPVVLVSLGTVFHRTPGLYERILEALRDEPIELILAVGRDQDPSRFGPQPPNVHIERYLPLPRLLPRCALFITHGGFNSTKEALSVGIPLVVIPIAGDQPYCAERVAALGLGETIAADERTPKRIRAAARSVLEDPGYRARSKAFSGEMQALPSTDDAVKRLEQLASDHRARRDLPVHHLSR